MKTFLTTISALLISTSSFAVNLACVTEFPTTSIYGEVEGDDFVVKVYHHNGTGYMPLHIGVITPNDLPEMQRRAEDFERLGELYEFRYPVENCQRIDQDILSCNGGKETEINGVKVRPFSLYTMRISSEMDLAKFDETQVSILMEIEGQTRHFASKYMANECYQSKRAEKIFSVLGK